MTGHSRKPEPSHEQLSEVLCRDLFATLETPPIPAEIRSEGFLESIYQHAAEAEATGLEPVLAAALTPVSAPEDATWVEVTDGRNVATWVQAAEPAAPDRAPGLLWTRIRGDLATFQAGVRAESGKSVQNRYLWRAAAALVVTAGMLGLYQLNRANYPKTPGTPERSTYVFQADTSLVVDDRLLGGG